jgi:hydrogenase nickel incorporation protein HypA/HybF
MHELSIALSIVEGASQEASRRGNVRIHGVHLKLGALSGVVKEALLFSFAIATQGTQLEGSKLVIEEVPAVVYCSQCDTEKTLPSIQRFCCPTCGMLTADLVSGRQLELVGLELSELETEDELADSVRAPEDATDYWRRAGIAQ